MKFLKVTQIILMSVLFMVGHSKIYENCEFAEAMADYGFPEDDIPTWVCTAFHESALDTSAHNVESGDYGIFQINRRWWCSETDEPGGDCNALCNDFLDDDITDDVTCVNIIFNIQGFDAWHGYTNYCAEGNNTEWTEDC